MGNRKKFLPYEEAIKFSRKLGLLSINSWKKFSSSIERPKNVPSEPHITYKNKGWINYDEWLNISENKNKSEFDKIGKFVSYLESKEFVKNLGLKTHSDWKRFCKYGNRPNYIPSEPNNTYKNSGWESWSVWLGSTLYKQEFLEYNEAVNISSSMGLRNISEWTQFCKNENFPNNIPKTPSDVYKNNGWVDWYEWLGNESKRKNKKFESKEERVEYFFNDFKSKVLNKEGKIIDGEYENCYSEFTIECNRGHRWIIPAANIRHGSWCAKCAILDGNSRCSGSKDGLEKSKNIAIERNGECISEEYISTTSKLKWRCHNGHVWDACYNDVNKGSWCPICGGLVSEHVCKYFIEEMLGVEFKKIKPSWLLNDRGNKMEYDGYNEEFKIAFEYHGKQHYENIFHFHKTETLERRKFNDKLKQSLSEENGVKLIIIPYYIKNNDIPKFIYEELLKINLNISIKHYNEIEVKYVNSNELSNLKQIAIERGGECTSDVYMGNKSKHDFICHKGHRFSCIAGNFKKGDSMHCPVCKIEILSFHRKKYSIEDMEKLATDNDGSFLSGIFEKVDLEYKWLCDNGHEFFEKPINILIGRWFCKECKNKKKD